MANILKEICGRKKYDIANLKADIPLQEVREYAENMQESVRGFGSALKSNNALPLIAEIKKASPSKGMIRDDFDVTKLAKAYKAGGATCLSVLTDKPYFQGDYDYLEQVKEACKLPVLQKDFMLEEWQIYHARIIGADCILLILAALEDGQAAEFESLAFELGLDVLLETHNQAELDRALKLKSNLVGVNNRNLRTLEIDLQGGKELLGQIKDAGRLPIAESGLYKHDDLLMMQGFGAEAFLIGESLMTQDDVKAATKEILGLIR